MLLLLTFSSHADAEEDKSGWPVIVNPIQAGDPRNGQALACREASATRAEYDHCLASHGIGQVLTLPEAEAALWGSALLLAPVTEFPSGGRPIQEFPGTLLLPSRGSPPFEDLVLTSAASYQTWRMRQEPGYTVVLGQLTPGGARQAVLSGSLGRTAFVDAVGAEEPDCPMLVTYCTTSTFDSTSPDAEIFRKLTVGGMPAVVHHQLRSPSAGHAWSIAWYDPVVDTSFGISFLGDTALRIGPSVLDPHNVTSARGLAEIAEHLAIREAPLSMLDRNPPRAMYRSTTVLRSAAAVIVPMAWLDVGTELWSRPSPAGQQPRPLTLLRMPAGGDHG